MSKYFQSSYLKVERAKHHISDLENFWDTFSKNHKNLISQEKEKGKNKISQKPNVKKIPPEFGLIIGDAIHNLRTALDHLVFAIVCKKDKNSLAHFPIGNDSKKFKASLKKNLELCPKYLQSTFEKIEAFQWGAGENIWKLHRLDIDDKHHQLILQYQTLVIPYGLDETKMTSGEFECFTDSERFLLPGQELVLIENNKPISFSLSFSDPPFQLKKVVPTLLDLSEEVENILDVFERKIKRK